MTHLLHRNNTIVRLSTIKRTTFYQSQHISQFADNEKKKRKNFHNNILIKYIKMFIVNLTEREKIIQKLYRKKRSNNNKNQRHKKYNQFNRRVTKL